ncbi:tumor necrosis factor receptor superfamily member 26-like isoform X2 [Lithobates pipiens]
MTDCCLHTVQIRMERVCPEFPSGQKTCDSLWTSRTSQCLVIILLLVVNVESLSVTTRTDSTTRDNSYYRKGKRKCLKCPAGTYVMKDCTISNTQGVCHQCEPGATFSEFLTGLPTCLTCTKCRPDQEEVSPCNITKNTFCHCKRGTYCPAKYPCDLCLPCTANCPEGQVLKQACNATMDILCVPETYGGTRTVV